MDLLCGMPTTPLNLDKYEAFYPGVPGEEARLGRYIQDHYGFVLGDGIDRLHRRSYRFQLHVQRRRTRLLVRKFNAVGDAAAAAGGALRKVVHAFGRAVGKTKLLDELRKRMAQPEA